jgi:hypothetical protein
MHDDEEHLVVGRPALTGALQPLASEQPIELEVVGVIERTMRLFVFHPSSLRARIISKPSSSAALPIGWTLLALQLLGLVIGAIVSDPLVDVRGDLRRALATARRSSPLRVGDRRSF